MRRKAGHARGQPRPSIGEQWAQLPGGFLGELRLLNSEIAPGQSAARRSHTDFSAPLAAVPGIGFIGAATTISFVGDVHSPYPTEDFKAGDQTTWRRSASGPVQLSLAPLTWDGHSISETDIRTTNGVIHVIDGVVVPDDLAAAAGTSTW